MKSLLVAFPLLAAASSLTAQTRPARLVADSVYEANGPTWRLAIGDRIALRLGPDAEGFVTLRYFPRARARTTDGVRRWQSRTTDGAIITIEVRRPARSVTRNFGTRSPSPRASSASAAAAAAGCRVDSAAVLTDSGRPRIETG